MDFNEIVGKTLESIEGAEAGSERVVFNFADGTACVDYHSQDCCESVDVNRIEGDLADIIGSTIIEAEHTSDSDGEKPGEYSESWTWTRRRIRTAKGEATIVWLGESNGYYGETPYFQITHGKEV
jgi:hypothetical protein